MPTESMCGNLLQRDFDHNLFEQTVGYPWLARLTTFMSEILSSFGSPGQLSWLGAKRGLSTETDSKFITPSFLVFVEKTGG